MEHFLRENTCSTMIGNCVRDPDVKGTVCQKMKITIQPFQTHILCVKEIRCLEKGMSKKCYVMTKTLYTKS